MKKAELRKLYLQRMKDLSVDEHEQKSKSISSLFLSAFDISKINALHTFLPIIKNKEVNTHHIIDYSILQNPGLKIVIPKSDFTTMEMTGHVLSKEMKLVMSKSGIMEPEEDLSFDEKEIDLVVLPLLAFDKRGFRVGYGKGFYDRFLAKCRHDVVKVGLSLFPAIEEIEDTNAFDIPMDYCVTPEELYSFK